jgi:hypothetical protein
LIVLGSDAWKKSPSLSLLGNAILVSEDLESIPQRFWSISSFPGDDVLLVHPADQDSDASAAPHPSFAVNISACHYCDRELVPRAESVAFAEGRPPICEAAMPLA